MGKRRIMASTKMIAVIRWEEVRETWEVVRGKKRVGLVTDSYER